MSESELTNLIKSFIENIKNINIELKEEIERFKEINIKTMGQKNDQRISE